MQRHKNGRPQGASLQGYRYDAVGLHDRLAPGSTPIPPKLRLIRFVHPPLEYQGMLKKAASLRQGCGRQASGVLALLPTFGLTDNTYAPRVKRLAALPSTMLWTGLDGPSGKTQGHFFLRRCSGQVLNIPWRFDARGFSGGFLL